MTHGLRRHTVLLALLALAPAAAPAAASCVIDGRDVTAEDADRALRACVAARGRFVELMGEPVPQVLVMVEERAGYRVGILEGHAVVLWPSSHAMARQVGEGPAADAHIASQWRDVLRHEIAHALTAAHFFPEGEFESTGYGTPLPDWFEEGVAIWAEPRASRESRLAAARALPDDRLDLRSILTMRHPAAGNAAAIAVRDGAAAPLDTSLWDFYQQSIAVLAFVHGLGGAAAVRELATRLTTEPGDPAAAVGLAGLPGTFEALEAAWWEWLGR
jgi:hypothetical protein